MLYMYAVVDGLPATWHPPPAVTPAAPVTRHQVGPLLVLGSTLDVVPPANPRTLALHHDVVASAVDALAVLPFRYGTTVADGDQDAWLRVHQAALATALAQVRLDSGKAHAGPGAGELRGLAQQLVDRAQIEQWRYRPAGTAGNVVASVAFLLPRADLAEFLARIAPIASRAVGVAVVPTGPWPAYSFVPALDRPPLAVAPPPAPSPWSGHRAAG
jgi:hypothetical protein